MSEITKVSVDVLKVHPRNEEFFDDISGEEYQRFKESIKEDGIITELIVAPDMTIISGHQRCKAAKELGIKMVPIRIREDLDTEDKKLKVLLAANFGRSKNDERKQRKVADEYVKLRGYKNGGDRKSEGQVDPLKLTLKQIANELGTSEKTLKRMIRIERSLTEEMKEFLDDGVISKTIASDLVAALSFEEQEELISSLDTTKKITQKEMQKYIDEIKRLKENPVMPEDYESNKRTLLEYRKKLDEYRDKVNKLKDELEVSSVSSAYEQEKLDKLESMYENRIKDLEFEKMQLEEQMKLDQEDIQQFNKLKEEVAYLTKKKSDIGRQIASATELAELTVNIQKTLEKDLAPIKFKRCMEEIETSDVAYDNLMEIIEQVDKWSTEMKEIIDELRPEPKPLTLDQRLDMYQKEYEATRESPIDLLKKYHEGKIKMPKADPDYHGSTFDINEALGVIDIESLYEDDEE